MSIQLFSVSDGDARRREFALMLVDETDGKSPETGEANGQPQIRKPGEISWTDTDATLIHIGNGHYIVVLVALEINVTGNFSIRYKSANTAEFQEVGHVQVSSNEVSLDEVNSKLDKNRSVSEAILWRVDLVETRTEPDPFVNPL